jgi:threonine dehydrogenase-like Zn-dependent dehydrogenase
MRALVVKPRSKNSAAVADLPEPLPGEGPVLVRWLALGICGTDREIFRGEYGTAPPGEDRLVLGHESLGRVLEAPAGCGLAEGDLVVGIVRHPDPEPCPNCAVGEWDMCRNGKYTEHGIKQLHGFGAELFRGQPERLVKVSESLGALGVLLEPASVIAKAWEHIERIGERARWTPRRCLVTGAGPIGLLAALMARQRGLEVDVLDRVREGPKPELVRQLGATYHTGPLAAIDTRPDVALECTGAASLVFEVMRVTMPGGIVCLAGISTGGREVTIDMGELNRSIVLENDVVFGSVNANRRHYELAAEALVRADQEWLRRLISRRVPLSAWKDAFESLPDDVKVVIDLEH